MYRPSVCADTSYSPTSNAISMMVWALKFMQIFSSIHDPARAFKILEAVMTWNTRDWLQLPTRYPYPFGLSQVLLNPQNRLFNTVALQAFKVVILGDASLAGA